MGAKKIAQNNRMYGTIARVGKSPEATFRDKAQRVQFEIGLQLAMRSYLLDTVPLLSDLQDHEALVEDMAEAATDEMLRFLLHGERPRGQEDA
jgi:hypothetical protein